LTKKIIGILFILSSAWGLVLLTACDSPKSKVPPDGPVESLALGTSATALSSLIWVAKARGYFAEQHLDIDFRLYESGHLAIRDLFAGKLDLATATEFAAVSHGLERADFRIISILDQAQDQQLVARRDRGITQLSDLKNKRVGVAQNTSAEYYLQLLLVLEKIQSEDIQFVNLLPSEQVKAVTKGDVDAVMVWEPFATMAKQEMGTNAVSWAGQSGQDEYWLLLSTVGIIEKKSRAIRRFLTALASAEDLIKSNEIEAIGIMEKQLENRNLVALWRNHRFGLGLHRPLIMKMEAELEWVKSGPVARQSDIPDLHDFVYFDALNSLEPTKIKMLH
jgi:ABC-type nitrate/sulfonate/bicarbonate transport system substrate-binding protein